MQISLSFDSYGKLQKKFVSFIHLSFLNETTDYSRSLRIRHMSLLGFFTQMCIFFPLLKSKTLAIILLCRKRIVLEELFIAFPSLLFLLTRSNLASSEGTEEEWHMFPESLCFSERISQERTCKMKQCKKSHSHRMVWELIKEEFPIFLQLLLNTIVNQSHLQFASTLMKAM